MAIKPIRNQKNKNPPFLSHEFVIQNHADIISCVAMVFVVGLMLQATSSLASVFIALHHNVTGQDPTPENPRGETYFYETGWKDYCAVFFYTLICIIMHAILQEYVLDKISKKLHLSKFKLSRFNESGQLVVFYAMSFVWGLDIILREKYFGNFSKLWEEFPNHPMLFVHKLFFIIQLSYYLHMLPELYFQKIKKEEQQPKIIHSIVGFSIIAVGYVLGFHRISVVLLSLHYFSEFVSHTFNLVDIFDREEKLSKLRLVKNILFVATRFGTMVLAFLVLFYGIGNTEHSSRGLIGLGVVFGLQGYLIYHFLTVYLKSNREIMSELASTKKVKSPSKSTKKERKQKESDLPEADQNTTVTTKKVKSK
uniref:CSON000269 protein n=1 Tax=Culicoides sonorensis TaxID=179676 RepID=A0A336ME24_CULSO